MARPAELNDETTGVIVEAIEVGCPARVACRAAGIGLKSFKSWMARGRSDGEADAPYRTFRVAVLKARATSEARALEAIRGAMPCDWRAAAWFLERSRPRRWGRVDRLKARLAAGAGRGDHFQLDVSKLSDAELTAIVEGKTDVRIGGKGYAAGNTPFNLRSRRPET